jgi:hypothetical protein
LTRWLALVTTILVTSCSPLGDLRTLDVPPERAAQLTVIRLSVLQGSGNTWVIAVDDHAVLGLRAGEHATITVEAGDRIITSDCVTAFPLARPGAPLRVPVKASGHHYVTLGACSMTEVTEVTAGGLMATSRPVHRRAMP